MSQRLTETYRSLRNFGTPFTSLHGVEYQKTVIYSYIRIPR